MHFVIINDNVKASNKTCVFPKQFIWQSKRHLTPRSSNINRPSCHESSTHLVMTPELVSATQCQRFRICILNFHSSTSLTATVHATKLTLFLFVDICHFVFSLSILKYIYIIFKIIITYHNSFPPQRKGSHAKLDNTHTLLSQYT